MVELLDLNLAGRMAEIKVDWLAEMRVELKVDNLVELTVVSMDV